jgi:hypothetical protein
MCGESDGPSTNRRTVDAPDAWSSKLDGATPNGMHARQMLIPLLQAGLFGQQAFPLQEGNDLFGHKLMPTG